MQKPFLLFFFVVMTWALSMGQCERCSTAPGFDKDFCFTDEAMPGYCAQFKLGEKHFYFQQKYNKAPRKLSLPESLNLKSMLAFVNNKANKVKKAQDILFIKSAMEAWNQKKVDLVAEKAAEEIFTGTDFEGMTFEEKYASGLKIHVVNRGDGPLPKRGQTVRVHYRGYLTSGKIFDESYKRGQSFSFPLGMGRVIKGWDEGIAQLPVGSRALLYLPASIAYGNRGAGSDIPPGATLIFDVVLMGIQ